MGEWMLRSGFVRLMMMVSAAGLTGACSPAGSPTGVVATPLEISEAMAPSGEDRLKLVHVWATWCDPCREEFPELLRVYREEQGNGLSLLLVSADDPNDLDAVNRFLREQQSPVGSLVSTELTEEFIELFSTNWSGALPASFFYGADGTLLAEWEGKRSLEEYRDTIQQLLETMKGATP